MRTEEQRWSCNSNSFVIQWSINCLFVVKIEIKIQKPEIIFSQSLFINIKMPLKLAVENFCLKVQKAMYSFLSIFIN